MKGWHSRGYLPHFDNGEVAQLITFRLADSFPRELMKKWKQELLCLSEKEAAIERSKRIEAFLDKGYGQTFLKNPCIAKIVEDALLYFDGIRYLLCAWVVMPNHVHVLIVQKEGFEISGIVHTWKSFSAKQANKILNRSGKFWQEDYFDRHIRDEKHYKAAIEYIENNPVKAGLSMKKEEWDYGSATFL